MFGKDHTKEIQKLSESIDAMRAHFIESEASRIRFMEIVRQTISSQQVMMDALELKLKDIRKCLNSRKK